MGERIAARQTRDTRKFLRKFSKLLTSELLLCIISLPYRHLLVTDTADSMWKDIYTVGRPSVCPSVPSFAIRTPLLQVC